LKGHPVRVLGEQLRLALAEAHRLAAARLELAHEEDEEHADADEGSQLTISCAQIEPPSTFSKEMSTPLARILSSSAASTGLTVPEPERFL